MIFQARINKEEKNLGCISLKNKQNMIKPFTTQIYYYTDWKQQSTVFMDFQSNYNLALAWKQTYNIHYRHIYGGAFRIQTPPIMLWDSLPEASPPLPHLLLHTEGCVCLERLPASFSNLEKPAESLRDTLAFLMLLQGLESTKVGWGRSQLRVFRDPPSFSLKTLKIPPRPTWNLRAPPQKQNPGYTTECMADWREPPLWWRGIAYCTDE